MLLKQEGRVKKTFRKGEQMPLESLGALPKVGDDGEKRETPDRLRASPKNL